MTVRCARGRHCQGRVLRGSGGVAGALDAVLFSRFPESHLTAAVGPCSLHDL